MNTNEIKEKLKSKEYDFLRTDKHLGKNIIFLTTGGSYAYGTNVETSDLDIRGIAVETSNEILGSAIFEQFEDRKTDTVVYALRKILKLMLNCNPNVLEILGTKDEHIFICNKYGKMIKDNKDLFLSKRAIQSFGGYASAQLRRLQNALARDNYPQREKEIHILNTIKTQIATMKDRYEVFSKENLNIYIDKSKKEDFESELFIDVNFKHYPLRDFKNIYAEMSNVIKDYDKLNHRNSKKDTNHLNKHAMHLIRLFLMGTELLEGKGINTYREKDREFLLKIRKGEFSYSEIFEMVNDYEKKFDYAAKNTSLKDEPDYDKVEELMISINRDVILNGV
ncbi:MAG: DNA polymerase beta superfamily protein [Clostridium sp.]